jgi:hypothetical protein
MNLELDDEEAGFIYGMLTAQIQRGKISKVQQLIANSICDGIRENWVKEHGVQTADRLEKIISSIIEMSNA